MSAAPSACAGAPGAWPIRRRNGACAASPRASRSRSAATTSTSIASRPGMVDGPRFRDKVCADMAKRLGITLDEAMERHAADYALKRVIDRRRRRQRLPVPGQRRLAPDHRRRPAGRRRLGDAVRDDHEHGRSRHPRRQGGHRPTASSPASVAIDGRHDRRASAPTTRCRRRARRSTPRGLHVLPGAIDVHVHFRDPGYPHKEDWETGTAAAAFGGVTTVFDMPNTIPPTGTRAVAGRQARIAARRRMSISASTACSARTPSTTCRTLIAGGVIGFKLYMGNTFGKMPSPSTGAMLEAFEIVARDRQAHLAACRDQFDHGAARRRG